MFIKKWNNEKLLESIKKILIYPTTHIVMAALCFPSPVIRTIFA